MMQGNPLAAQAAAQSIPDWAWWIIALGLVMLAATLSAVVIRRRRRHEWSDFARRTGLRFEMRAGSPRVWGRVGERAVELRPTGTSSDGSDLGVIDARLGVELGSPPPAGLELSEVGEAVGGLEKLVEANVVEVGDPSFDQHVLVRGRDEGEVRRWLDPARRVAVLRAVSETESGLFGLADGRVFIDDRDFVADAERLGARLATLLEVARALDEGSAAKPEQVPG